MDNIALEHICAVENSIYQVRPKKMNELYRPSISYTSSENQLSKNCQNCLVINFNFSAYAYKDSELILILKWEKNSIETLTKQIQM